MPGGYIWGWDYDAEDWIKCRVDDAGKLIIGSGTIEVEQDTPADLQATVTPASGAEFLNYSRIPSGATQIAKSGGTTGGATVLIHTVDGEKTLFLTHWVFDVSSYQTATARGYFFVTNATDTIQYLISDVTLTMEFAVGHVGNPSPPLEIPAGWKVQVRSDTANLYLHAFIHGYEA